MKHFELRTPTLFCLTLLVGFCATNTACLAQEKTKQDTSAVSETADMAEDNPFGAREDVFEDVKFDILFSQSTSVEDFVAFLREKTDGRINILVARDARKVMIPSLELRGMSTRSALNAMGEVTPEIYWDKVEEGIKVQSDSEISLKVFNVSRIVDKNEKAQASMLSAIEIGLEMNNSTLENVSLKFHEETKLLFIRASESDLDIVTQVLIQLGGKNFDKPDEVETGQGGGVF